MDHKCIFCKNTVRPRKAALECEGCQRWQHRICNTSISRETYRTAVQTRSEVVWKCVACKVVVYHFDYKILLNDIKVHVRTLTTF